MSITFDSHEKARYARHLVLPEIGSEGQKRLKAARILCVGAGGLGSPALLYLAAAGVGTIGVMDHDKVDLSNLQRQILFNNTDLNVDKVHAAKERLLALNPNIDIIIYTSGLTADNAMSTIGEYDLVLDCTDNFSARYLINDACVRLEKPMIYASILRFEGQCSVFWAPHHPCYCCLYPKAPLASSVMNCANNGIVGAVAGILGSIQAMEAIKIILQQGDILFGRLLLVDALSMSFKTFAISKQANCQSCVRQEPWQLSVDSADICYSVRLAANSPGYISVAELQKLQKEKANFLLLDVREPFEHEICNIGGTLIPLPNLQSSLAELDVNKAIVIYCKDDARSIKAAKILIANGYKHIQVLSGGILAWIEEIDPSLLRY